MQQINVYEKAKWVDGTYFSWVNVYDENMKKDGFFSPPKSGLNDENMK